MELVEHGTPKMPETLRWIAAFLGAVLLHAAALSLAAAPRPAPALAVKRSDAVVLRLSPPPPPPQLVEVNTPSETPPETVARIAETHAKAMDALPRDDDSRDPAAEERGDLDALARAPEQPAQPRAPRPAPETKPSVRPAPKGAAGPGDGTPPAPEAAPESSAQPLERFQTAAAVPPGPVRRTESRNVNGSVRDIGMTNFEAIRSEIAPYLRYLQQVVEVQWNGLLLTRYSGTRPTQARLFCEIAADGTLLRAEIRGAPEDRIFAAICKLAVERAAPFKPFPFEVPDIYRNQNLELHWNFNYLMK